MGQSMTKQQAEELLDLIAARAKGLREVGVRSVNLGGVSFTLASADIEADLDLSDKDTADAPGDTLHDPWTFGVPAPDAPTVIPRRKRPL